MDMKPLEMLEERIQQAARKLDTLRKENRSLRKKLDAGGGASAKELQKANKALEGELKSLQKERDEIRDRVESILGELEDLDLDGGPDEDEGEEE